MIRVILKVNQGGNVGLEEVADIGDERPRCEEELEDVFDGFGSHGESGGRRKEALR